jgi:hypothetical protein
MATVRQEAAVWLRSQPLLVCSRKEGRVLPAHVVAGRRVQERSLAVAGRPLLGCRSLSLVRHGHAPCV